MHDKNKTFAVVGGDRRSAHIASTLAGMGYLVYTAFLESDAELGEDVKPAEDIEAALQISDVVIFPMPMLDAAGNINTPLSDRSLELLGCIECVSPDAVVLGGRVSEETKHLFAQRGLEIIDYLEREELAVLNAVLTVEGAVEISLKELPITLFESCCVVTGFGRIAKLLARMLDCFGAEVHVAARKKGDLAWIRSCGYRPVDIFHMDDALQRADILFNTVPNVILGERELKQIKEGCLVIDLASKPGGVDFEAAKKLGVKTMWALSLPGKVAPITAGKIILDTIFNILEERGEFVWTRQK